MVFVRNHLHDGQTNAGAFIFLRVVQPLEESEELFLLVGVEAYAVVLNPDNTFSRCTLSPDVDVRSRGITGKLERIIE